MRWQTTAAMFKERGATLQLRLPDALPTLRTDRDRLLQVLLNLLSNATKFVPREGGRVELRLRADDAGVTVEVQDNGPGVPPDQQAAHLREVPPRRRRGEPAAGHRPGLANQPPDRRAFRWPHVVAVGAWAGRLLRVLPALVRRSGGQQPAHAA